MPDKKVVPLKRAAKKEPKKPPRRKAKKSAGEAVTEQTGTDTSAGTRESPEPEILQPDISAKIQESPVDSTPSTLPATVAQPDFLSRVDEFIDQAVKFINEKANEAVYNGSIEVGAFILKNFYDDDVQSATSRNPRKPISYSKLCQHPELTVKPETLGVMVRVAAQEKYFADENVNTGGLTYSHKAELAKLYNDQEKIDLVKDTLEEGWSVRQLKDEVYALRRRRIGEKPASDVRLVGHYVSRVVNTLTHFDYYPGMDLFEDQSKRKNLLKLLKGKTRQDILEDLDLAAEMAEEWLQLCQELKRDLEEIKAEEEQKKTKKS
jgi:hypothetical protein